MPIAIGAIPARSVSATCSPSSSQPNSMPSGGINTHCEREQTYGKRSSCCFQRWCHCNHHHYYGAGIEGAARSRLDRACGTSSTFRQLRFELHLCGDLLEQPPPSSSYRDTGRWPPSLCDFIFSILPVSHPGCDSLVG